MKKREILKEIVNGMTPIIEYYLGNIYVGDKDKSDNERIELLDKNYDINNFKLKESVVNKINNDENTDFNDLLDILDNKFSELIDENNNDYLLIDNTKVYFYKEPGYYNYYVRNINDFNKVKLFLIKSISDKSKPLDK